MRRISIFSFICFCVSLTLCGLCKAETGCTMPISELQAGVNEVDFGSVKVKFEEYNKLVKMKIVSSLNEDWTSVSTETDAGQITGYFGKGSDARIVAQLVVKQGQEGFDWALFKGEKAGSTRGTAYFYIHNSQKCLQTDFQKWVASVKKIFGAVNNSSAVNIENDSLGNL